MVTDPSKRHLQQILDILRQNALHMIDIRVADDEEDMQRATDFVVTVTGGSVAVRIRDLEYLTSRGYNDLTIRSYSSGYKTELQKIQEGHSRWSLYAWEDKQSGCISEWVLCDVDAMRACQVWIGFHETANKDRKTKFIAIPMWILRACRCILANSQNAVVDPPGGMRSWTLLRLNIERAKQSLPPIGEEQLTLDTA